MGIYAGKQLDKIAYPLGGIGSGMICLQGTGNIGNVSLYHHPDYHNVPLTFSAITINGENKCSRVVEAPVPEANIFALWENSGLGLDWGNFGLPRYAHGQFEDHFPFAELKLQDPSFPVDAQIVAWSPFIPGDEDRSSLPMAALEYKFTNTSSKPIDATYYFCSKNFMNPRHRYYPHHHEIESFTYSKVHSVENGFILEQLPAPGEEHIAGSFMAYIPGETVHIDTAWVRINGSWKYDTLTALWKKIQSGESKDASYSENKQDSPGATLSVAFHLEPGCEKTIKLLLSWYVPTSNMRIALKMNDADIPEEERAKLPVYRPWYADKFASVKEVADTWRTNYETLKADTAQFTKCFYNSDLPPVIIDAIAANLCILKSPTILRQTDGRLWGWEGCRDTVGSCHGSCTHVWNYAQAICHLFPRLERSLRETEFFICQDETGHQTFRAPLPLEVLKDHSYHAAADGQLGGIVKVYRDWHICGDTEWLRKMWPKVKESLAFAISHWDPDHLGVLREPHHNTYDIEFWGADGMCSSFYLAALHAASEMATTLGDDDSLYKQLYEKGRKYLEEKLYNGEYFYQQAEWENLHTVLSTDDMTEEVKQIVKEEGPRYQYKTGCLSDGVIGYWLGEFSGLKDMIDEDKLRSNLESIYRNNFKRDLSQHSNTQRPGYALGKEAGLLLCTWPNGGKPTLPFIYSDEVWTGIEYQVASHMISKGMLKEGLDIVTTCRGRYNGIVRNPYNEYECGHWYARAMASYALLQAYTGLRYDKVTQTLYVSERNSKKFKSFLCTADGFGTVHVENHSVNVSVVKGTIAVKNIIWVE